MKESAKELKPVVVTVAERKKPVVHVKKIEKEQRKSDATILIVARCM
ncbi:hypothetical protein [Burkholderia ubonensis]|nr:hypothetical protein [Burkholderia ubonensis]